MPGEGNPPVVLPQVGSDEGTENVLRQHYPPARAGEAPDQFRPRLQAVAENFGLQLNNLPGHLLVPQYDAVLIGDRSADLPHMESFRELVQQVRFDDGTAPRILINEPLAGASSTFLSWLNDANRRSTFVFIYVTKSFLANTERMQYLERLYNESVSGPPERRHRIVPVFAPDVVLDGDAMNIPESALFLNTPGLRLEMNEAGQLHMRAALRSDLGRLMRGRLDQRRQRENAQIEQLRDWAANATRREGSLLLQRMSDFFTDRMGREAREVKQQLEYFSALLQEMGEPGSGTRLPLLQEIGSQQFTDSDSGHATMASSRQTSRLVSQEVGEGASPPPPMPTTQQPLQPAQRPQRALQGAAAAPAAAAAANIEGVLRGVENLHVGTSQRIEIHGQNVHVHVTYVQQFVAGATHAEQNVEEPQAGDHPGGAAGGGHE